MAFNTTTMFFPDGLTGTFIFTYATNSIGTAGTFFTPTIVNPVNVADAIMSYPDVDGGITPITTKQYVIVGIIKLVDSNGANLGISGGAFPAGMNSATVTITQLNSDASVELYESEVEEAEESFASVCEFSDAEEL